MGRFIYHKTLTPLTSSLSTDTSVSTLTVSTPDGRDRWRGRSIESHKENDKFEDIGVTVEPKESLPGPWKNGTP